ISLSPGFTWLVSIGFGLGLSVVSGCPPLILKGFEPLGAGYLIIIEVVSFLVKRAIESSALFFFCADTYCLMYDVLPKNAGKAARGDDGRVSWYIQYLPLCNNTSV